MSCPDPAALTLELAVDRPATCLRRALLTRAPSAFLLFANDGSLLTANNGEALRTNLDISP